MKKVYFGIVSILVLLGGIFFLLNNGYSVGSVQANPDYICVKNVQDMPCEISSCSAWGTDGSRTCYGKQTTQVSYYLIRTSCEPGYSQVSLGGNVGGNSGRQGGNYVSQSSSCSIQQFDNVAPYGDAIGK
ncbi:MAG: hypothetical protein AB7E37_00870 [Candidatus Altimarinota bacterium]